MGGQWDGTDDGQALDALRCAVELGCDFFDTAWQYGDGHAERLLGELMRAPSDRTLYIASKIPPRTGVIPAAVDCPLEAAFPPSHIRQCVERSLANLGVDRIDLMQFHTWQDAWARDESWQQAVAELRDEGLVRAWGIAANRWEPANCVETLATGLIDAVQVTYNIFEQAPEDTVLPLCRRLDIAVIARVPFDEGSLTGTLTAHSAWAKDDWRSGYFHTENLAETVSRVEAVRRLLPAGIDMPTAALRFILANPDVSTVIPGMRQVRHVRENAAAADGASLPEGVLARLRTQRWDRRGHVRGGNPSPGARA